MATLADSFLADLEDLEDEKEEEEKEEDEHDGLGDGTAWKDGRLGEGDLSTIAQLTQSERYGTVLSRVKREMDARGGEATTSADPAPYDETLGDFIVQCNQLVSYIDTELSTVHTFVRDSYRGKFPELESLVLHPVDYARVVQAFGNESDPTQVNLDGLLPSATIMVVSVTASTTSGKPLKEEGAKKVEEGCAMILQLDEDKRAIQKYVESRMTSIAKNLSVAIGAEVAALLMGAAGGLVALSKMPACNIQVLGQKKKTLAGYSSATAQTHRGFLAQCPLVTSTPPSLQTKAIRLVAGKCALLARVDAYGQDPEGKQGQQFKELMLDKIEKWQEPPPARKEKPLPVPDLEPKKRRGGRRLRKMKERYGQTEMQKAQNRLNFNQPEAAIEADDEVVGLGSIGQVGGGGSRLRMFADTKSKYAAKAAKKLKTTNNKTFAGAAAHGLATSLAFTPIQGIELANPNQNTGSDAGSDGTKTYFSELNTFSNISRR